MTEKLETVVGVFLVAKASSVPKRTLPRATRRHDIPKRIVAPGAGDRSEIPGLHIRILQGRMQVSRRGGPPFANARRKIRRAIAKHRIGDVSPRAAVRLRSGGIGLGNPGIQPVVGECIGRDPRFRDRSYPALIVVGQICRDPADRYLRRAARIVIVVGFASRRKQRVPRVLRIVLGDRVHGLGQAVTIRVVGVRRGVARARFAGEMSRDHYEHRYPKGVREFLVSSESSIYSRTFYHSPLAMLSCSKNSK